jgi:very-short-patch-repair endonuclease
VEVSGRKGHSSPAERARDAQRRNELQDLGFDVYEYTWEQVTQSPDQIVVQLRSRLAA